MKKPIAAIVGKPNVGKSTFFNRVAGKRLSIVEDRPGVTRDRLYYDCEWCGKKFTLIDTGGLEVKTDDVMFSHIREQVFIALEMAEVVLFFVDYKTGICEDDFRIAQILRKSRKRVLLVVNKADTASCDVSDFYSLGFPDIFPVSSENGINVADLLDEMISSMKFDIDDGSDDDTVKIAFIGCPNVGKSSLVNKILGYDRSIVTDIAGTTRDTVDTPFELNGKKYVIIDTAGMRRNRSIEDSVEGYSVLRAKSAVARADVCVVVFDASRDLSEQDVRIAGYAHEEGKPSVIVMNKWDLVEKDGKTINRFEERLSESLKFMDYYKSVYISAMTGKRVSEVIKMCDYVYDKSRTKISTGKLNDVILDAVAANEPPTYKGRRLKIYYCTQPEVAPPLFVLFANDSQLVHFSYRRYLENCIRKAFSLDGTPIRIAVRDRDKKEQ